MSFATQYVDSRIEELSGFEAAGEAEIKNAVPWQNGRPVMAPKKGVCGDVGSICGGRR